jgi:hypothetical protein
MRQTSPVFLLAAVAVWAAAAFSSSAAPSKTLYTVDRLAVDGSGASPTEARDKALALGRERAFGVVFKRLTQQSAWGSQPKLTVQELEEMVTAFTVDNERHSTTRYLAEASFNFSPARVRDTMQRYNMTFSETQAKPVLVVPIKPGVGWANDTLWASSWNSVAQRGSLRPVLVPLGDATEIAMVGNVIAESATWQQFAALAEKYGATEVWVTSAGRSANGLAVTLSSIKRDGRRDNRYNIVVNPGEGEGQLSVRAAAMVRAAFEENWKAQTAVNFGLKNSIEAAVAFNGLPDWVSIRNELTEIRLIQQVNIDQMLTQGARLRLDFVGKIDQLQATLKQANLILEDNGTGLFILSRMGIDTSVLPPALLAPPTQPPSIANPLAIPSAAHTQPGMEGEAPPAATPSQIPAQ